MNKINQLFSQSKGRKLLSLYFCAGTPTLEGTASVIKAMQCKGVDMVEVGIPFSDPMANGPVIQDAATRALRIIMLITPQTSKERIHLIDHHTNGFIYMVSSAATTGAQQNFDEAKQEYFRRIDAMHQRNPRMIGFGISNKQTLESAQQNADGAIIGSKFVKLLSETDDPDLALERLFEALSN